MSASRAEMYHTPQAMTESEIKTWFQSMVAVAKSSGMFSEVIVITPFMASVLLENYNNNNRTLNSLTVAKYAKMMKENRFLLIAQGISFDVNGNLNNGQHRLHAVVKAGIPVEFYITFGEISAAFLFTDSLKKRSGADTLSLSGEKNTAQLAASLRILMNIDSKSPKAGATIENDEIPIILEKHPLIRASLEPGMKLNGALKCSSSGAAVAHYLLSTHRLSSTKTLYSKTLEDFWTMLVHGNGLELGDPIMRLRKAISLRTLYQTPSNAGTELAASIIITWNAWLQNRKPNHVKWLTDNFPTIL